MLCPVIQGLHHVEGEGPLGAPGLVCDFSADEWPEGLRMIQAAAVALSPPPASPPATCRDRAPGQCQPLGAVLPCTLPVLDHQRRPFGCPAVGSLEAVARAASVSSGLLVLLLLTPLLAKPPAYGTGPTGSHGRGPCCRYNGVNGAAPFPYSIFVLYFFGYIPRRTFNTSIIANSMISMNASFGCQFSSKVGFFYLPKL